MEISAIVILSVTAASAVLAAVLLLDRLRRADRRSRHLSKAVNSLTDQLRQATAGLAAEKEKLNSLLSAISEGFLLVDKENKVVMFNKAVEHMFNLPPDDFIGLPLINLVRDHEIDSLVRQCLGTSHKQTATVEVDKVKHYNLTAVPLEEGAFVLVQNLSHIRHLEKVRQDFVANISHELRTPIASLKAIAETLQDGAVDNREVALDFLQRIQIEIDKLAQMVSELGELSLIESGDVPLNMKSADVAAVIERVVGRMAAQADRAGNRLEMGTPPDLPAVRIDEDRIEQVLVNLIHNAIKFTPPGGRINVSARAEKENVLVSVADTGAGIPPDDLPHIFERFYKVDKARSGGGTGLGLAIAKHIVRSHGGDVGAESEPGKGSTFTFSLPLAESRR